MKQYSKNRVYVGSGQPDIVDLPDLVGIQLNSYEYFLQTQRLKKGEKLLNQGLEAVFRGVFPVESPNKDLMLIYDSYTIEEPQSVLPLEEYRKQSGTYSVAVKAKFKLLFVATGEIRQKEVYMGDIPLMTDRGTFIVNGAERVVVSQIHRSPGVIFEYEDGVYSARIIPHKGVWLEFELESKRDLCYVRIDKKRKTLVTFFLRAIGYDTREKIIDLFYKKQNLDLKRSQDKFNVEDQKIYLSKTLKDSKDNLLYRAGSRLYLHDLEILKEKGFSEVEIIDFQLQGGKEEGRYTDSRMILQCFEQEEVRHFTSIYDQDVAQEVAVGEIFQALFTGEMVSLEAATSDIDAMFFSSKRYTFGKVGRYRFDHKFHLESDPDNVALSRDDVITTVRHLMLVSRGKAYIDDIDHLGNRRVRSVGELLENSFRIAFMRVERLVKERMTVKEIDLLRPQDLISIKLLISAVKEFFESSQLSQFMDQVNPLAELTHKRRISALGPGGLNRDRAGFEVRDVHYTHYGRMCPIETPEGQNIGLIASLATYARVNDFGFLETPYRKIIQGKVTDEIEYLSALDEEYYYIVQANAPFDSSGNFLEEQVSARRSGDYLIKEALACDYMDVSPKQIISISSALVPFLEHDDANRALMGANMQRQAVPLLFPDSPIVGTGLEAHAALDSGVMIRAKEKGVVSYASSTVIRVQSLEDQEQEYYLKSYSRTNQDTCFQQRPVVFKGDHVEKGGVLADGPSTDGGDLALGSNLVVAFLPWNGYNYEDAVVISERLVKEDVLTSVHIKELSIDVRETKLGPEQVTSDIPNISETGVQFLDEEGVIMMGATVKPGDILVGKITPKVDIDTTPEFRLLNAIFGEKVKNIKDASLRVPHGVEGTVIGIQELSRENGDDLMPGLNRVIKILIAKKRKIKEGDKIAGRHGNKGIIARVLPEVDMPYMADGTPVDICLNPLGVPSRMNLGQLMEAELGIAGFRLGKKFTNPVFQSAPLEQIQEFLVQSQFPKNAKVPLYDGLSGEKFENPVFVGCMYVLKLHHLIDDKMHARSTGPYSLVTQQPLGGKAQFGGQRFGEMEVWALEAYGATHTLRELLTVKSDDMVGRNRLYADIVKGDVSAVMGLPESFNVLVQELRGLGIELRIRDFEGESVPLTERDAEVIRYQRKQALLEQEQFIQKQEQEERFKRRQGFTEEKEQR